MKGYLQRHEFLRHVLTLMSGTALAQVVIFATTPLLTRMLPPATWGAYTAVFMAASGLVVPVAALRYDMAIVLPRSDDEARRLLRVTTLVNTVLSVMVVAAMAWWGMDLATWLLHLNPKDQVQPTDVGPWMPLVGLIVWSYAQVNIVNYWSNRRKRYAVTSTNTMINSCTTAGGRLLAAWAGTGVVGLVAATVVGQFAALTNFFARSHRDVLARPTSGRPTRELLRAYSRMPLLNAPNALVDAIRISGIPLLLAHYFGSGVTGAFNMAWTLVQTPMNLINAALSQVFFQKLSVTPRGQMLRTIRMSIVRSGLVGIIPFALIWLLGPWFMPIFLGQDWAHAGVVAAILVPWLFVNFVTSPISTVFVVARRQGLALVFAALYMAVPLWIIVTRHQDLDHTLRLVSWSMGLLLLVYLLLATWVAKTYDDGYGAEHDHKQRGDMADDLRVESAEDCVEAARTDGGESDGGPSKPASS